MILCGFAAGSLLNTYTAFNHASNESIGSNCASGWQTRLGAQHLLTQVRIAEALAEHGQRLIRRPNGAGRVVVAFQVRRRYCCP